MNLTNTAEVRDLAGADRLGWLQLHHSRHAGAVHGRRGRKLGAETAGASSTCGAPATAESTPGGRGVVLGVHHTGKDAKTFRGSSAFEAGADTVYSVTPLDGAVIILDREKRKDGPKVDTHRLKLGHGRRRRKASLLRSHIGVKPTRAAETSCCLTSCLTLRPQRSLCDATARIQQRWKKPTFYRALSDLLERGEIINEGTEKRPFYKVATK